MSAASERARLILDAKDHWKDRAISHHKAGERFPDDHDERLWAARDRILADAALAGRGVDA